MVRQGTRPGWNCPDPGLPWQWGPGLRADRGLCAMLRQALHFPGRLSPRPALLQTAPAAPLAPVLPALGEGVGVGSDVAAESRMEVNPI